MKSLPTKSTREFFVPQKSRKSTSELRGGVPMYKMYIGSHRCAVRLFALHSSAQAEAHREGGREGEREEEGRRCTQPSSATSALLPQAKRILAFPVASGL